MIAGYDPNRIAALDLRTRSALGALDRIGSTDDAAGDAIAALDRLRSVLNSDIAPAVAAIRAIDPLAAGSASYDNWLAEQLGRIERTRHSHLNDVDLSTMLHIELTRQMEANGVPDLDDPFWASEFPEWVDEFERRARIDPDFVAFIVDEAGNNPMIGYIVAAGNFDVAVLVSVTAALTDGTPGGAVYDTYRDGAISALLARITEQPAIALTLLGEPGMVETLLTWNDRDGGAFGLDGEAIGALFTSALGRPLTDLSRTEEAQEILRQLVELTHGPLFDRGLPPGTAAGITTALIGYLPYLVGSLGLDHDVYFSDSNSRLTAHLGSPAEVVDLFGALLRDPASRAMLVASIPALALGTNSGLYDLAAVNDYVHTIVEAAGTEQIEEEIHARRTRDQWNQIIGFVSSLLEAAFKTSGGRLAVAKEVVQIVEAGARWIVEQITADDVGLDNVRATAFLLLVYGVSVAFIDRERAEDDEVDGDDPRLVEARELVDEIDRLLDAGAPRSDVERQILNLRRLIEDIGGDDALDSLSDPRIAPPEYDDATDTELSE